MRTKRQQDIIDAVNEVINEYGLGYDRLYMEKRKAKCFVDGKTIKFHGVFCPDKNKAAGLLFGIQCHLHEYNALAEMTMGFAAHDIRIINKTW